MYKLLPVIVGMSLLASSAFGTEVQYDSTTGIIHNISPTPFPPETQFQTVSIPGPIIWPAPSGCPTGQMAWTIVRSGSSLIVNPDLIFYHCIPVTSAQDVDDIVSQRESELLQSVSGNTTVRLLTSSIWGLYIKTQRCPPSSNDPTCPALRTEADRYITRVVNFFDKIKSMYQDADAFKAAHGF